MSSMSSGMTYDEYLSHYGVKGMKWGVRRKSSDAKTANALRKTAKKKGTDRLSNDELKKVSERSKLERNVGTKKSRFGIKNSPDSKIPNKKTPKALSNGELEKAIKRMELEKRYSDLKGDGKAKSGANFAKDIFKDAAKNVATSVIEDAMRGAASGAGSQARKYYDSQRVGPKPLPPGQRSIGR